MAAKSTFFQPAPAAAAAAAPETKVETTPRQKCDYGTFIKYLRMKTDVALATLETLDVSEHLQPAIQNGIFEDLINDGAEKAALWLVKQNITLGPDERILIFKAAEGSGLLPEESAPMGTLARELALKFQQQGVSSQELLKQAIDLQSVRTITAVSEAVGEARHQHEKAALAEAHQREKAALQEQITLRDETIARMDRHIQVLKAQLARVDVLSTPDAEPAAGAGAGAAAATPHTITITQGKAVTLNLAHLNAAPGDDMLTYTVTPSHAL